MAFLAVTATCQPPPREDPAEIYSLGMEHFRQGRMNEARSLLERAVALSPDSAEAWKALGLTLLKLADYAGAVDPLKHACDLNAAADDACYLEGRVLFLLARYDEAESPLEKARRNTATQDQAKLDRAIALNFDKLGKAPEAERHFRRAVQSYRSSAGTPEDPRLDYGAFLVRQGRAAEALEPLKQALVVRPDSLTGKLEISRALVDLDRCAEALPYLETAVAAAPTAWNIRLLLGKTYVRLGRVEDGERELREGRAGWAKANQGSSKVQ